MGRLGILVGRRLRVVLWWSLLVLLHVDGVRHWALLLVVRYIMRMVKG